MDAAHSEKAADPEKSTILRLCLGLSVFLGAWLLFGIEPLAGKIITPILGGASEVWVVCLLFFQIVVLGGYFLTYSLSRLKTRAQVLIYVALFAASLVWSHIPAGDGWTFAARVDPTWALLCELTAHLSIACIVLASISGMMQVWQTKSSSLDPYRLYGLSNLGSFGALLTYPTLVEPHLPVSATLGIWQILYYVLFALLVVAAALVWRQTGKSQTASAVAPAPAASAERLQTKQIIHWLYLSTLGSAGLLAFTSHLTADVAPVPLLWVLPLAIYLWSFAVAFGRSQVKTDLLLKLWIPMLIAEPIAMAISPVVLLSVNLILLFQLCMVTNAELSATKPNPTHLPTFYLVIAIGGAIGGMLVAIVAPLCFSFAGERGVVILTFTVYHLFTDAALLSRRRLYFRIALASLMTLAVLFWLIFPTPDVIHRERNFFGSVSVKKEGEMMTLFHGRVKHGQQYLDPGKAAIDVYPYGPPANLILAFVHSMHADQPLNIGVIGLGAGSMAVEARKADRISFYEIDPKICTIAQNWFTYLAHSPAKVSVDIGDGRLLLRNSNQRFDAICIDAFNGDAVPVHLLTVEAMHVYLQRLKPDGVLFFHITNSYLDLAPIIGNVARLLHLDGCELVCNDVKYVAVASDSAVMRNLIAFAGQQGSHFSGTKVVPLPVREDLRVWTDDFSNLFSVLKLRNN